MQDNERIKQTRACLWRWGQTMSVVKRKEREIASMLYLVSDATQTLHAQQITDMPRGGGTSDPTFRAVLELEKRREAYEQTNADATAVICARLAEKRAMDALMRELLTDRQIEIISLRYELSRQWGYIALKVGCAECWARKTEYKAVEKLSRRINTTLP